VNYDHIRRVTAHIHEQIASGTFDAPTWNLVRIARLAAPIYAPLGTRMSLGDHVRVARTFLEAFKSSLSGEPGSSGETDLNEKIVENEGELAQLQRDLKVSFFRALF